VSMWLSKIVVVDGVEISVSAEGGSAKEALSIIDAAAEELGAAPAPPEGAAKGEGRRRRTKAEMDAARAALASAAGTPVTGTHPLPGPAEPARVFAPPVHKDEGRIVDGAKGYTTATEDVVWSGAPALPQEVRSVGFEPPPAGAPAFEAPPPSFEAPPVKTIEQTLCEKIDAELKATIALKPEWSEHVHRAFEAAKLPFGVVIASMSAANLQTVLDGVLTYQHKVKEAIARK